MTKKVSAHDSIVNPSFHRARSQLLADCTIEQSARGLVARPGRAQATTRAFLCSIFGRSERGNASGFGPGAGSLRPQGDGVDGAFERVPARAAGDRRMGAFRSLLR